MQNAKCKMQNAQCTMQNAKCKMQNAQCKMQNAKCKMQNANERRVAYVLRGICWMSGSMNVDRASGEKSTAAE
jgi:hypothetical protein